MILGQIRRQKLASDNYKSFIIKGLGYTGFYPVLGTILPNSLIFSELKKTEANFTAAADISSRNLWQSLSHAKGKKSFSF